MLYTDYEDRITVYTFSIVLTFPWMKESFLCHINMFFAKLKNICKNFHIFSQVFSQNNDFTFGASIGVLQKKILQPIFASSIESLSIINLKIKMNWKNHKTYKIINNK